MTEARELLRRARAQLGARGAAGSPDPDVESAAPAAGQSDEVERARVAIPTTRSGAWQGRAVAVDRYGVAASCYQQFAWKVRRELETRGARSVAVTSAVRNEGKTVTACNLALALASFWKGRVALVDLDLRGPSVATALGIPPGIGVEHCLGEGASIWDVRRTTDLAALDVFPARGALPNAHLALGTPSLATALAELRRAYEVVVIDSPPVLPVPDTPLILLEAETCVCVVRAGRTHPGALQQTLQMLPRSKLLGVFLNSVRSVQHSDLYRYYDNAEQ